EDVVSLGNSPEIYADAILHICKLYAESPLVCVSGVTGADVRRRIEAIMSGLKATGLGFAKRAILTSGAIAAVAGPLSIGLLLGAGRAPHLFAQTQPPIERQTSPPAVAPPPAHGSAPATSGVDAQRERPTANPFEMPASTPPTPVQAGSIKPCG